MPKYILRLDDACERRDVEKWDRIEKILDNYGIKPLVGIIPHCEDPSMREYPFDENFWNKVNIWKEKKWTIALHGYNHVYSTSEGGINPVNKRSEFAGESLKSQENKIGLGVEILRKHGYDPLVFFAPSHTFDLNTLKALQSQSNIRFISDTIANKPYFMHGFTFVPQQSGKVRKLPFKLVTFCYHPNMMSETDFEELDTFLKNNYRHFCSFPTEQVNNKKTFFDMFFSWLYFKKRK